MASSARSRTLVAHKRQELNPEAAEGQSAAIRLGLKHTNRQSTAYMFMVGDQPFLQPDIIDMLIAEHRRCPEKIIVPLYDGKRGTPAIFPALFRDELLALRGDCGGRSIIERSQDRVMFVACVSKRAGLDMDTVEDYEICQKQFCDKTRRT